MSEKNAYAKSGVDVEAGYEVVERIKKHVSRTERAGVMGALGGFGGVFDLSKTGVREPILVSGTDGVGTKLMLAIKYQQHDTIGQDCVAMCVNDIIAAGAEPLYFLDYIATGKITQSNLKKLFLALQKVVFKQEQHSLEVRPLKCLGCMAKMIMTLLALLLVWLKNLSSLMVPK